MMLFRKVVATCAAVVVTLGAITCSATPLGKQDFFGPQKEFRGRGGVTVVSGQVRGFTSGAPIGGALVTAENALTHEVCTIIAKTGADGRYLLRLPQGRYILHVQAGSGFHTSNMVEVRGAQVIADLSPGDQMAPIWSFDSPEVLSWRKTSALVKLTGRVLDNHLLRHATLAVNGDVQFSQANMYTDGYDFDITMELGYGAHEIGGSAIDASDNLGGPSMEFHLDYQVPEPSTVLLLGLALLGGAALLKKRG
jgi:hypothetical protein